DNPMPRAEVVAKCRDLITPVLGAAKCAALIERVLALESMAKHRLQQIRPRSLPGLTRQSIVFDEALFSMDARVKPGHDKSRAAAVGIVPGHGHAQKEEEAAARQRNGRVNSGDVSIFYRAFGARGRTPILLMHGANYFDSYDWIGVAEALASDREVASFDKRGFGETGWSPSKDYSVDANMGDMLAVIAELKWQRPTVVGHSASGRLSISFAAN